MKVPKAKKLPSGAWRVQVMVDGKRVSVTDDDPKVVVAKAAAMKAKMVEVKKSPRDITVEEATDRYIESKDTVLSPSTIAGYKRTQKNLFKSIKSVRLSDLTQERVQKWVNALAKDKSPKTIRNAHGLLSTVLAEYKPEMTLRTTLPQKQKYDAKIPTEHEIKKLLEVAKGTEMELPFLLAVWLGLRASEIRGITWDCIEGDTLHIKQAIVEGENGPALKGTKSFSGNRKLTIPQYIQDLIERTPKEGEYLVALSGQAMYKRFSRMCELAEIPHYRFHDLRHANASVMLALGIPDKYAMERMGHATTNMLKTVYQHTMKSKQDEITDSINKRFEDILLKK